MASGWLSDLLSAEQPEQRVETRDEAAQGEGADNRDGAADDERTSDNFGWSWLCARDFGAHGSREEIADERAANEEVADKRADNGAADDSGGITVRKFIKLGVECLQEGCVPSNSPDDEVDAGSDRDPAQLAIVQYPLPPTHREASEEQQAHETELTDIIPSVGGSLGRLATHLFHVDPRQVGDLFDETQSKIAEHYLFAKQAFASLKVEADILGTSAPSLSRKRRALAMAGLACHHADALQAMRNIIADTQRAAGRLLLFSESCQYDETPMRTRASDPESTAQVAESSSLNLAEKHFASVAGDVAPQKILATTWRFSLLVEVEGSILSFLFALPCWHQSMASKHAECYMVCLERTRPQLGDIPSKFERRQRLVSTDGDTSCECAEQALSFAKDYDGWSLLHLKCVVHRFSNIHTKAMSFMQGPIQHVIDVAQSLGFGFGMARFRRALRQVIEENFEFIEGPAPPEFAKEREPWLSVFFSGTSRQARLRRAIVESLCTGQWSARKIAHYCTGCCTNARHCKEKFAVFFVRCMVGAAPKKFPRDSWVGHDQPLDWIGGLACIHHLFDTTYRRWCASLKDLVGNIDGDGYGAEAGRDGGGGQPLMLLDGDAEPLPAEARYVGAPGPPSAEPPGQNAEVPSWKVAQEEQAKRRKRVLGWISAPMFLAETVVLRRVGKVHRVAMKTLLWTSGSAWEQRQRAEECRAVAQGQSGFNLRSYRVLSVAQGIPDAEALALCKQLLSDPDMWRVIPENCRSSLLRSTVFKMLSRTLCLLEEFKEYRSTYPFKAFKLLVDTDLETEILRDSHLHDNWTAAFVKHYTSEGKGGIASTLALADVRCTLMLAMQDTVPVEVWHSRFRRQLEGSSVQTHRQALEDASAAELLRRFRSIEKLFVAIRPPGAPAEPPTAAQSEVAAEGPTAVEVGAGGQAEKRRKVGGGGAYRAFISQQAKNRTGTPQFGGELSQRYREAMEDPVQRAALLEAGRLASAAHRRGQKHVFGEGKRDLDRANTKHGRRVQAQVALSTSGGVALHPDDLAQAMVVAPARPSGSLSESWSRVLALKAECFKESQLKQELHAAEVRCLSEFVRKDSLGGRAVEATGPLAKQSGDHLPTPNAYPNCFDYEWMPSKVLAKSKALLSISTKNKVGQLVQKRLLDTWAKLHTIVGGPARAEIARSSEARRKDKAEHPCKTLGRCVCEVGGAAHVPKIARKFKAALNAAGKLDPGFKPKLLASEVVVVFIGRELDKSGPPSPAIDESASLLWANIGYQWQSPWESLFHCMDAPRGEAAEVTVWCNRQYRVASLLEASGSGRFLARLDTKKRWDVCFWALRCTSHMLGSFMPNAIDIDPIVDANPTYLVWCPKAKAPPKKKARKGWTFDVKHYQAEADEEDSDDTEEGEAPEEQHGLDSFAECGESGWAEGFDSFAVLAMDEPDDLFAAEPAMEVPSQAGDGDGNSDGDDELDAIFADHAAGPAQPPAASAPEAAAVELAQAAVELAQAVEPGPADPDSDPEVNVISLRVGPHRLAYYKDKRDFYGYCGHPGHGSKCRKTRTNKGSQKCPAQGRPLAFLLAWCQLCGQRATSDEHKWLVYPSREQRLEARTALLAMPEASRLLKYERPRNQGEDSEPWDDP